MLAKLSLDEPCNFTFWMSAPESDFSSRVWTTTTAKKSARRSVWSSPLSPVSHLATSPHLAKPSPGLACSKCTSAHSCAVSSVSITTVLYLCVLVVSNLTICSNLACVSLFRTSNRSGSKFLDTPTVEPSVSRTRTGHMPSTLVRSRALCVLPCPGSATRAARSGIASVDLSMTRWSRFSSKSSVCSTVSVINYLQCVGLPGVRVEAPDESALLAIIDDEDSVVLLFELYPSIVQPVRDNSLPGCTGSFKGNAQLTSHRLPPVLA